jgi:hypothetical protein
VTEIDHRYLSWRNNPSENSMQVLGKMAHHMSAHLKDQVLLKK